LQVERIAVGKIKSPHGTKGEVKIISLTDFPSRFKPGLALYISPPLLQIQQLVIENVKFKAKEIILKFMNIDNREQAEDLKGRTLQVSLDEVESLPEGSYWQFQILGLKVFTTNNAYLGRISEILQTDANDVYVVESPKFNKGKILIPAIKQVVKQVDLEKGIMVIEPMPGLLEGS
jgi:16S rRNA processing protein RimM